MLCSLNKWKTDPISKPPEFGAMNGLHAVTIIIWTSNSGDDIYGLSTDKYVSASDSTRRTWSMWVDLGLILSLYDLIFERFEFRTSLRICRRVYELGQRNRLMERSCIWNIIICATIYSIRLKLAALTTCTDSVEAENAIRSFNSALNSWPICECSYTHGRESAMSWRFRALDPSKRRSMHSDTQKTYRGGIWPPSTITW